MSDTAGSRRRQRPYAQLADEFRKAIAEGSLKPGEQLPPTREIAAQRGVAPMTVQRALRELREEGLVESEQGRGVFVRRQGPTDSLGSVEVPKTLDDALEMLAEVNARLDRLEARAEPVGPDLGPGPEMDPAVEPGPEI